MIRTQIYLTNDQKVRLEAIARSRSASMADIVRDAVSEYIAGNAVEHRIAVVQRTFGAVADWSDREGTDIAREIREQWQRSDGHSDGGSGRSGRAGA